MINSVLFGTATIAYILAMIAYISYLAFKNSKIGITATTFTIIGFTAHTLSIILRWLQSYVQWTAFVPESSFVISVLRSVPLRNFFESMVFFIWCLIFVYLIIEFKYKNRSLGAFVVPIAGLALCFIDLSGISKDIRPLIPALQSNWLLAHVLMSFIAYAAFALSFSTGLMRLILSSEMQKRNLFWIVFAVSVILLSLIAQNPETVIIWIISFALVLIVDVKLNFDITKIMMAKEKDAPNNKFKAVFTAIGLSLISIAVIIILIQLVKLQLIKADEGAGLKHLETLSRSSAFTGSVMGIVSLIFFMGIALIKYLLVKKETYLFWTLSFGLFAFLLLAMGFDIIMFKMLEAMPLSGKSMILKASILSTSPSVALASCIVLTLFLYIVWQYGTVLKNMISKFNVSHELLDDITYKGISVGFLIFTIGSLIFGAVWAEQAWGTYWSWDPKETWSLITFFFYAFFLHSRFLRGWRGEKAAVAAVIGFAVVIFTYLGVNMLLSGLHSYGGI